MASFSWDFPASGTMRNSFLFAPHGESMVCAAQTQSHMPRMPSFVAYLCIRNVLPTHSCPALGWLQITTSPHSPHAETTPLPETPFPTQPSPQPTASEDRNSVSPKAGNSGSFCSHLRESSQYTPARTPREKWQWTPCLHPLCSCLLTSV